MGYVIGNNQAYIANLNDLLLISNKGKDGDVYRYNDEALKIIRSEYMYEEKAELFMNYNTKQIVLQKNLVYDDYGVFCGYTTKYIEPKENAILQMTYKDFANNCHVLYDDFEYFSRRKVLCRDVNTYNMIESDKIYVIDTDRFLITTSSECYGTYTSKQIHEYNKKAFNALIYNIIVNQCLKCTTNKDKRFKSIIRDYALNYIYKDIGVLTFIKKELSKYKTINEAVSDASEYLKGKVK